MTPDEFRPNPVRDTTGAPEAGADDGLRPRAEARATARAGATPENLDALSPEQTRSALHELLVHQIELEMQNDELRRTQEDLEISRARYFDLYDLAPVGYFTLGENGSILEANLTAAKLLGVTRSTLARQPISRFVQSEDQDTYYLHRKKLLDTGAPQVWEMRVLRADAAPVWVRVETTLVQDAAGAPVCRAVMSDIEELKREQAERAGIEAQNHQLQKAEGLGRMAAAIAHRFNNHLTAVMGNLELAIGDLAHGSVPAMELRDALEAARAAAEVSNLLLTYLGKPQGRHGRLDLSEVCRGILPILRAAMPIDTVLEADLPLPGPAIQGDAKQIQQVLTNLVTNAWEARGGARSVVRVTVKTVTPAEIPAHCFPVNWHRQPGTYACLAVTDTGSGIGQKVIEDLFDPFFSTKFTGRGMGLPVVLGIARAHGGAVAVSSTTGFGSTFRVFLPNVARQAVVPVDHAAQPAQLFAGGTVLLVEDEPMLRKLGQAMLERLGFAVLLAEGGVEAVEVFRLHSGEIRCAICDVTMPGMDGWQTLAALREMAPGLPAILASGYDKDEVMAGNHAEQPQAFLSKPYQSEALRAAIARALGNGPGSNHGGPD